MDRTVLLPNFGNQASSLTVWKRKAQQTKAVKDAAVAAHGNSDGDDAESGSDGADSDDDEDEDAFSASVAPAVGSGVFKCRHCKVAVAFGSRKLRRCRLCRTTEYVLAVKWMCVSRRV